MAITDVLIPLGFVGSIAVCASVMVPRLMRVLVKGTCWEGEACSTFAWQLRAVPEGGVLSGELDGIPVWMGMEMHEVAEEGFIQFCVVRAKVPGALPQGFVAAPRHWMAEPGQMPRGGHFSSGDPELDEMYFFQSAEQDEGRAFVQNAQVQQVLRSVLSSGRVAFVEQGHAGIASLGVITETEEADRQFAAVVRAAQGLSMTESRVRMAAGQ
jgi:hypothetical protein